MRDVKSASQALLPLLHYRGCKARRLHASRHPSERPRACLGSRTRGPAHDAQEELLAAVSRRLSLLRTWLAGIPPLPPSPSLQPRKSGVVRMCHALLR